jgi:PAS domain S-box-containing protein
VGKRERIMSIRILLVEDDKIDQMAFERLLKIRGLSYQYKIAENVSSAREILKTDDFDIAVLDYNLSDGTAFELFDLVKDAPIIITTGQGREEIAVDAMKAGACDYLTKDPERNYLNILPMTISNAILRKKESHLLKVLSHAVMSETDSVCITDTDNRIIYVNDAFTEMYGFKKDDVLGKHVCFLWKKEYSYDINCCDDDHRDRVETNWSGETCNLKKDGSEVPIYLSRSVVKDDNGDTIAVVEIARDISERLKASEEREKIIKELKTALSNVKTLSTLLPICASCKKIRDDKGYWNQVEEYISAHTDALFSHGLCPDCAKEFYPELDPATFEKIFNKDEEP